MPTASATTHSRILTEISWFSAISPELAGLLEQILSLHWRLPSFGAFSASLSLP